MDILFKRFSVFFVKKKKSLGRANAPSPCRVKWLHSVNSEGEYSLESNSVVSQIMRAVMADVNPCGHFLGLIFFMLPQILCSLKHCRTSLAAQEGFLASWSTLFHLVLINRNGAIFSIWAMKAGLSYLGTGWGPTFL